MNAFLCWLFECLAIHYGAGYRHGYTQAVNDAWNDREKMLASMAETQAVLEGLMANMIEELV